MSPLRREFLSNKLLEGGAVLRLVNEEQLIRPHCAPKIAVVAERVLPDQPPGLLETCSKNCCGTAVEALRWLAQVMHGFQCEQLSQLRFLVQ